MALLWAEKAASYLKISVPCRGFATVLKDLKYADSHEWVKVEGKSATIGITDHAEDQLGEVVYVELPMVEVNKKLSDSPGLVNSSTYGELLCFMDPDAYSKLCEEEDASH